MASSWRLPWDVMLPTSFLDVPIRASLSSTHAALRAANCSRPATATPTSWASPADGSELPTGRGIRYGEEVAGPVRAAANPLLRPVIGLPADGAGEVTSALGLRAWRARVRCARRRRSRPRD